MPRTNALSEYASRMHTTPQHEPIPGRADQVKNSAGGFVFAVDDWTRLHRFLILGTEGGTYYVGQRELTRENADVLFKLLASDGERVVDAIIKVSEAGDAPKQGPILFSLAAAASAGDLLTRKAAYAAIPRVCRTGTMLFDFITFARQMRGWGPGLVKAVARWYERDPQKVAYQAVKYRQRNGWTHRDVLRLTHPRHDTDVQRELFAWIVGRGKNTGHLPVVSAFRRINEPGLSVRDAVNVLSATALPWEALPDRFINEPEIWDVLLETVGVGALLRQLPRLTRIGLLKPLKALDPRLAKLVDVDALRSARVHPVAVLNALFGYQSGVSEGGRGWTPVPKLVDLLDDSFHAAFGALEPSGKRHLLGLDVSGSMQSSRLTSLKALNAAQASAAMAMATVRVEPECIVAAFSAGYDLRSRRESGLQVLPITARHRLDDVIRILREAGANWGATDCSLPMRAAQENKLDVDTFAIYTDNETWHGPIHPTQALANYRQQSGIASRLAVVGMTSTGFSIADPRDSGQLDLVGFDAAAPHILSEFSAEAL